MRGERERESGWNRPTSVGLDAGKPEEPCVDRLGTGSQRVRVEQTGACSTSTTDNFKSI